MQSLSASQQGSGTELSESAEQAGSAVVSERDAVPRPTASARRYQPGTLSRLGPLKLVMAFAYLVTLWIGLFMPVNFAYPARWYGHFQDLLHVPGFALLVVALAVWTAKPTLGVLLAAIAAPAVEILQAFVGRQCSLEDMVLGWLGCALGAAWYLAVPKSLRLRMALTVILGATPFVWKYPHYVDAIWYASSFPVLSDFSSPYESSRWYTKQNWLGRVPWPDGTHAGKVTFFPDPEEGESKIVLYSFFQDWSAYRYVCCEFTVPDTSVTLLASIRNLSQDPDLRHYDVVATYPPGRHVVRIDLHDAASGRIYPKIDLKRVRGYYLVVSEPEPRVLYLHRIWLE